MKRICVFCGAHAGKKVAYVAGASDLGRVLAQRGLELVTGGGSTGLMGATADAALDAGGEVIGVIPAALDDLELGHRGIDLRVVETMHERKQLMHDLSDGFMALPGGIGSFEEVFEALTWQQLGFHPKPIGFLNLAGYYDPLLTMLDHAAEEGFFPQATRDLICVSDRPEGLLDQFERWTPPAEHRWEELKR